MRQGATKMKFKDLLKDQSRNPLRNRRHDDLDLLKFMAVEAVIGIAIIFSVLVYFGDHAEYESNRNIEIHQK